ncbi:MAG: hypothetical protein ACOZAN_03925 [Patescibacteria group bacterium]
MSDFDFITDTALRSNINRANELILELVLLSESEGYQERPSLVSSLRKTIVIHTASIVEAVLLWKLKQKYRSGEAEIDDEWEYRDPHKIHDLTDQIEQIVWCRRKQVKKRVDRLDFMHVTRLCEKHALLRGEKLVEDVNAIREMRNNIHIGNLADIDRDYQPADLEFCFSVLKRVKEMIEVEPVPSQYL